MSSRQIIDQPEFPRGNNTTTMVRNPGTGRSQQRYQYSYNQSQRSMRTSTRSSQGNSIQQFSQVQQDVQCMASASNSTPTTDIVIREHHREVQVQVQNQHPRRPRREITHFSHRHPLQQLEIEDEDFIVMCVICQLDLQGPAYSCMECDYFLHKSCFDMPRHINHQAHRNHPLTLLSSPAYQGGEFVCNACRRVDSGFNYHCSTCNFDLHVVCASLPRTVNIDCYDYPLTLYYSFPIKNEAAMIVCLICSETVLKNSWMYYDRDSDFVSHIYCAFGEEDEEEVGDDAIFVIQNRLLGLEL